MSFAFASRSAPGKQNRSRFGIRGNTVSPKASLHGGVRRLQLRLVVHAENSGLETLFVPKAAESPRLYDFCCFPHASPAFASGSGKQKTVVSDRSKHLNFFRKFGAGDAIRTRDPNLGKVLRAIPPGTEIAPIHFFGFRSDFVRFLRVSELQEVGICKEFLSSVGLANRRLQPLGHVSASGGTKT
jgi:hypothetical protein